MVKDRQAGSVLGHNKFSLREIAEGTKGGITKIGSRFGRKIYELLLDGRWHHSNELNEICRPSADWRKYYSDLKIKYKLPLDDPKPDGHGQNYYRLKMTDTIRQEEELKSAAYFPSPIKRELVFGSKKVIVDEDKWNEVGKKHKSSNKPIGSAPPALWAD